MKNARWSDVPLLLLVWLGIAALLVAAWFLLHLYLGHAAGGFGEPGDFERWRRSGECLGILSGAGVSWVFPVAYDWKKGAAAVARMLPFGDECVVAWDSSGRTWGGGRFEPPVERQFRAEVALAYRDVERPLGHAHAWSESRLRIFAGNFAVPGRRRLEQQRCERRALAHLCREGNLVVPVDADEQWIRPHEVLPALAQVRPGWVACGNMVHVWKANAERALVLTAEGAPVAWHRDDDSGVKGAAGMRTRVPAKVVNWWLADRDPAELRLKLGAVSYMEGHDPSGVADGLADPEMRAGDVPNVGGTLRGKHLQAIATTDLVAGNWEGLKW